MPKLSSSPRVNLFPGGVFYNGERYAVQLNLGGREIELSVDPGADPEQLVRAAWSACVEAHRLLAPVLPILPVNDSD